MNNTTLVLGLALALVAIVFILATSKRLRSFDFSFFGLGKTKGQLADLSQPTTVATVTNSTLKSDSSVTAEGASTLAAVKDSTVEERAKVEAKNPAAKSQA